jgi:iron complex transport system ATP-binding protein
MTDHQPSVPPAAVGRPDDGLADASLAPTVSAPAGASPATLAAAHLRLAYDDRIIVDDLSVTIPAGAVTVIVGANACGKSTLLRALARLLAPRAGTVLLDGDDIRRLPTRTVAQRLGLLPQQPIAPDGIVVSDLVARGRHPHQRWFRQWSREDQHAVDHALAATGTTALADRSVDELSGGQRQRVWIAMALAQGTEILLLDEPTTFLDLAHQVEVLDLLADLNAADGRTIVCVLHDLNLACRYATHLIALRDGAIAAQGRPADVITPALVDHVFDMPAQILIDPVAGSPLVIPIGRHHRPPDEGGGVAPPVEVAPARVEHVVHPPPPLRPPAHLPIATPARPAVPTPIDPAPPT